MKRITQGVANVPPKQQQQQKHDYDTPYWFTSFFPMNTTEL